MENKKEDFRKLGARMAVAFTFVIALVMVLNGNLGNVVVPFEREDLLASTSNNVEDESEWREVMVWSKEDGLSWLGAEASEAASGYLGIYFCNHSAGPDSAYTRNASTSLENYSKDNGFDYAHIDDFDLSFSTSDAFDIVVRCKFVRASGPWNGTGWRDTWVRVNITLSGGVVISDETGTWCETFNSSSAGSYFGNVYWDNSGSGYVLAAGDSADITEVSIEAKYSG